MCIGNLGDEQIVAKSFVAFKRVRKIGPYAKKTFISGVPVSSRSPQDGFLRAGRALTYRIGKETKSPMPATAGVYLYLYDPGSNFDKVAIRVRVPKGAKVRYGASFGPKRYATADRVKVLSTVKRYGPA